jgi:hypothetical protein
METVTSPPPTHWQIVGEWTGMQASFRLFERVELRSGPRRWFVYVDVTP